jgi:tripartite-type tricarboxylate transporter receptor subunit TctC
MNGSGSDMQSIEWKRFGTAAAAALALATATAPSAAQDYPTKAVRIILGFAAGGPNDLATRAIAAKLQESLGQPFVVEPRPGANGLIAAELVAKAAPDGYTLLTISSSFTINPSTYAKLPFDTLRDFAAVSPIAVGDIVFVVNPVVPARTVKEFVALARAKPGKLNFASSGAGGTLHLGAELLKQIAGIDIVHIPYKGAVPALTDVIGGHVDSMFVASPPAIPLIKAGKVRALGVASAKRSPALPEVPTFDEAGYRGFEVDARYGIVAPAGTPAAVIAKLNEAIAKAAATNDIKERFAAIGLAPLHTPAADYATYLRADIAKWRKVVTAAKLQPQ